MVLEWVLGVAEQIEAQAKCDPDYMEWADQQTRLADAYENLLSRLDPTDRELILSYTEAREGMLYRLAQLAWQFGKSHR